MHVYEKIKIYMDKHGLDQDVIANRAGIDKDTFSLLMKGDKVLNAEELREICISLNVSPELFFETID